MKYIIGTGYHNASEWDAKFFEIWKANTEKYTKDYYCLSTITPAPCENNIFVKHNLGHIHNLIVDNKEGLTGWGASFLALLLVAYNCGADFIYKESDCLWFGDIVNKMYDELGDGQMIIGKGMNSHPHMPCSQSTFLIRYSYILEFACLYLSLPRNEKDYLPEHKFYDIYQNRPHEINMLSFGIDRERPICWDDDVWFCQQWTYDELNEAKSRGII
jgi:hypothetical protein